MAPSSLGEGAARPLTLTLSPSGGEGIETAPSSLGEGGARVHA